ncbi:hypothetical protein [Roseimicrobium sp. ORNL1]|uniref:hypothetical protein n=1 Tax=Roseimicrobium sp. ORNL1 TaxID=2711231 RepID=UPI0013E16831|nr:hypothetical protein [Roseimicrobium sp. ORNL1]QIF05895.1 hypothetical protein G5S37_31860 [Roseimicrobium sp. ORNL1]
MKRLGQPDSTFLSWPWRSFVLHVLGLVIGGVVLGAGISVWMARAGRVVETEVTHRFDLSVGLALSAILLSITVALRYWKRAPFFWACFVAGTLLLGRPVFGGGCVLVAASFMLVSSKLRDAAIFWAGTSK